MKMVDLMGFISLILFCFFFFFVNYLIGCGEISFAKEIQWLMLLAVMVMTPWPCSNW